MSPTTTQPRKITPPSSSLDVVVEEGATSSSRTTTSSPVPSNRRRMPSPTTTTTISPSSSSSSSSSPSAKSKQATAETKTPSSLLHFPVDLQVNILTFLRAYDLSALNQTCTFYCNPALIHAVVLHFADSIYPSEWTNGFVSSATAAAATSSATGTSTSSSTSLKPPHRGKKSNHLKPAPPAAASASTASTTVVAPPPILYNFEHLRNMELLVVARVLNSPEPACNGFFISKSWCKTALKWLEVQQQDKITAAGGGNGGGKNKKLSKKKQRLRNRKLSDAHPPWPNANSDLLCEHMQLSRCSNGKSARARRRLLDKQAWKILKKLYPDSTPIDSMLGECVQCRAEAETTKRNAERSAELAKLQRQEPVLENAVIRGFYTRRNGVPSQALVVVNHGADTKRPAVAVASLSNNNNNNICCPLVEGSYFVLPRAWCYAWRRYIKTGDLPSSSSSSTVVCGTTTPSASSSAAACPLSPPDAASLLCHAHRLALLPPHLEAYLYGESPELIDPVDPPSSAFTNSTNATGSETVIIAGAFAETGSDTISSGFASASASSSSNLAAPDNHIIVPGQGPDPEALQAMRQAGLLTSVEDQVEVGRQLSLLRHLQVARRTGAAAAAPAVQQQAAENNPAESAAARRRLHNERLDRENHCVVEIVTADEYKALEDLWNNNKGGGCRAVGFRLGFTVDAAGHVEFLTSSPCRACDATGRYADGNGELTSINRDTRNHGHGRSEQSRRSKKNRGRGYGGAEQQQQQKSAARVPPSLEY